MNTKLSNYLVKQILLEDTPDKIKRTIVIFTGRFQPFHNGHYAIYLYLVKKFGKNNIYIGTSNVVSKDKSPFNFKEKFKIITTMFDIPKSNVIQIRNPYKPVEILSKFDENTTAYVAVVGKKDSTRLGGKYFRKLDNNKPTEPYKDAGYVFIAPTLSTLSGTTVRNGLALGTTDEKKKFFETVAFPSYNKTIFNLVTSKLNEIVEISKETIEEWLLNENSLGTVDADDGPSSFIGTFDTFSKVSTIRAKKIGYEVINMIMTKDVEDYQNYPTYPKGPVTAVSFYPAGVIGAMTPNNQIDIYSSNAYTKWYAHATRKATLAGYELLKTQLEKNAEAQIKALSGEIAHADREIEFEFELYMNENITLPVDIGDTILMGKFKNKKVVVKDIGVDAHGMPTINGRSITTFRLFKKAPNVFESIVTEDITTGFKNLGIPRKDMPQIESSKLKNYLKYIKANGYSYKIEKIPISKLNLTQKNINRDKVETLMTKSVSNLSKPIVVSKGGYILDGHHRVLALYALNNKAKIVAVRINLDIIPLLKLSRKWDDVSFKHIHELASNIIIESEDDKFTHIGYGRYKKVGSEKDKSAPVYTKNASGHYVTTSTKKLGKKTASPTPNIFDKSTSDKSKSNVSGTIKQKTTDKFADVRKKLETWSDEEKHFFVQEMHNGESKLRRTIAETIKDKLKGSLIKIKHGAKEEIEEFKYAGIAAKHFMSGKNLSDEEKSALKGVAIKVVTTALFGVATGGIGHGLIAFAGHVAQEFIPHVVAETILKGAGKAALFAGVEPDDKALETFLKIVLKRFGTEKIPPEIMKRIITNYNKENVTENTIITEAKHTLNLALPASVKKIDKAFKKHGKKLYVVGGAVRDAILGKKPHDFDLSTDAKADEMVDICKKEGLKCDTISIKYGTVIIDGDEVTQFRTDIGKNRKLTGIDYTDIEGDVKRRDLTINALFYDIDRKEIVDLVGGIKDLKDKKIRTVGNAADRFAEDHLRKLRAVRFTSKLGGSMDTDTLLAIKKDPTLKDVSPNRIRMEFIKSIESAKSTKTYLDLMEKLKFLSLTFPNLKINKPYIDDSDYIVVMAQLLKKNSKDLLENVLNKIGYTTKDIINVIFLQSLDKFKPKDIVEYKKQQKRTTLTNKQIIDYGNHNKVDYTKFVKFSINVTGKDAPANIKGKEIGNWINNEEEKRYLNESNINNKLQIRTFKELFSKLPTDLQKRVLNLKHIRQDTIHHPEGNVLKHTITVVNRALKQSPDDINLAIAGLFHDIGKDETSGINPKTGRITHYDHEKISAALIKKYRNIIINLGGTPSKIFFIVKNHMRMKNFDNMRLAKQRKLKSFGSFDKLKKFSDKMDKGGLHEMGWQQLNTIDKVADNKMRPEDIIFTNHFFDRVNDPRNKIEITEKELIDFFTRLSKHKSELKDFLSNYNEIMVKDDKTNINIPFIKTANKLIAKTILRTATWHQNKTPELHIESKNEISVSKFKNTVHESIHDLVDDLDENLEQFVLADNNYKDNDKILLQCGGTYGHMSHPFDIDVNLTFGQLKDIANKALDGNLEFTREKTDGVALSISWKNGKLIAARNTGQLKNHGENAMDIKGIAAKFKGRGGLTDAYNFAMQDLTKAIGGLSQKQKDKIFANGAKFMQLEVIFPKSVNVIAYGQSLLIFHGTFEYGLDGKPIGESTTDAKLLAGMIKQINQNVQNTYTIQGPPIIKLPKNQNLSAKKPAYISKINNLEKEFGLKDTDGVAAYHQAWWENYIIKNSPTTLDKTALVGLVKRWAFSDKSFRLNTKTISDDKALTWAKQIDSNDHDKISKQNLMKFENIFLGIGADVLEFTKSVLTVNPDEALQKIKDRITQTIKDVTQSKDPKKIEKLKLELKRLDSIGGIDRIVPSEGIVFVYNDHTIKMTGGFAALNQLLGIFYKK